MGIWVCGKVAHVPQPVYKEKRTIGSLLPCKFWGIQHELSCLATSYPHWVTLQPSSLDFLFVWLVGSLLGFLVWFVFFTTRFLVRPWTHKASKPQGSASLHLPSAGIVSVITYSFVSRFWELNSSPELCPFLFFHFLPVISFLFHFSLTPFKRQLKELPKPFYFVYIPLSFPSHRNK